MEIPPTSCTPPASQSQMKSLISLLGNRTLPTLTVGGGSTSLTPSYKMSLRFLPSNNKRSGRIVKVEDALLVLGQLNRQLGDYGNSNRWSPSGASISKYGQERQ